jgi:hypothetical protein
LPRPRRGGQAALLPMLKNLYALWRQGKAQGGWIIYNESSQGRERLNRRKCKRRKTVNAPMSNKAIDEGAKWIIIYQLDETKREDPLKWKDVQFLAPRLG